MEMVLRGLRKTIFSYLMGVNRMKLTFLDKTTYITTQFLISTSVTADPAKVLTLR